MSGDSTPAARTGMPRVSRPQFRFSLRTMLVRDDWAAMRSLGYHIDHISRRYRLAKASHEIGVRFSIRHPYSDPRISWTRRLLGDKDVNVIGVPTKLDLAKSKELKVVPRGDGTAGRSVRVHVPRFRRSLALESPLKSRAKARARGNSNDPTILCDGWGEYPDECSG